MLFRALRVSVILGKIDIPHDAGQARDEPGPFDGKVASIA